MKTTEPGDHDGRRALQLAYRRHARSWHEHAYCYPVVSRRSGGLSIGVNLNPDKACNFDCVYCQVDRRTAATVRKVDLAVVGEELEGLVAGAMDGSLFEEAPFSSVPAAQRVIRDIAFSGDGEPTTYPHFAEAVQVAADVRRRRGLDETKLVLITDACYLTREPVRRGLRIMDENNGEVWAKLDAGTEAYYQLVNRPNYPLSHVLANILDAARVRPVVIQSLWMRLHGEGPPAAEIDAFCDRLNEILAGGGRLKAIQLYTVARDPAEAFVTMLSDGEVDAIAARVRGRVGVACEVYYGVGR